MTQSSALCGVSRFSKCGLARVWRTERPQRQTDMG